MKLSYIKLPEGTSRIRGIGSNKDREFTVGFNCDSQWGGGSIVSMELLEGSERLVRIRKDRPFIGPPDPGKANKQERYDHIVVTVDQYIPVESAAEEVPAAKPVQNQGNQQRR